MWNSDFLFLFVQHKPLNSGHCRSTLSNPLLVNSFLFILSKKKINKPLLTPPIIMNQLGMMMNSCWPYGGSTQQLNLASLDRPLYDSRTLAMLARQYQPSMISALLTSLSTNQNTTDDNNNNNSQRLTSTTNESNDEQTNENNNSNLNTSSAKKLWRPLDIMR